MLVKTDPLNAQVFLTRKWSPASIHPFVRLKDHPFVPTCPSCGVAVSGSQGWPQGHRSSRRAASLSAVRGNAKLWKGEDISVVLPIQNDLPKPQTTTNGDTHRLQLLNTNPAGLRLRTAQPRLSAGQSGCWRAPTVPHPAQSSPHRRKTASRISLNDCSRKSSIDCHNCHCGAPSASQTFWVGQFY